MAQLRATVFIRGIPRVWYTEGHAWRDANLYKVRPSQIDGRFSS